MLTRKVNAVLSLITTVLLLDHAIFNAARMLSRGAISESAPFMPWVLMGAMLLHTMVSIDAVISTYTDVDISKGKKYPKQNRSTIVQRISGILLVVFAALHVASVAGFMQLPQIVHAIMPPIFFTIVMVHISVSTSKALITLGIGNAKFVKIVDVIVKIICVVTLIADIIGFYLCQV